jgi:hypothetical protein
MCWYVARIEGTNEAKNILSNGSLERDEEGVESPREQEKSTQTGKESKRKRDSHKQAPRAGYHDG